MIQIGRLVMKIAGRDAGKYGLIIDVVDKNFVVIDGQVRRRKVNIKHIEPLQKILKITKNASHEEVVSALKQIGIDVEPKKQKQAKKGEKPVKKRTLKITQKQKEVKKGESKVKQDKAKTSSSKKQDKDKKSQDSSKE